jgi:C1A family cysteine protease
MFSWLFKKKEKDTTHAITQPVFGWTPDLPDLRDKYYFTYDSHCVNTLCVPPRIDLRMDFPVEIYDQGSLKSSVANAIASLIEFERLYHYKHSHNAPSRLFLHYIYRQAEGVTAYDTGAAIRTTIKTLNKLGVCDEEKWPYDIARLADKPDEDCYEQAVSTLRRFKYYRVKQQLAHIKAVLAEGQPIVFGMTVYESMMSAETAKTGVCPYPSMNERPLGGHVGVLCGYNDDARMFVFRNSWGSGWGDGGYGYLDYDYITDPDLAGDFWVLVLDVDSNTYTETMVDTDNDEENKTEEEGEAEEGEAEESETEESESEESDILDVE